MNCHLRPTISYFSAFPYFHVLKRNLLKLFTIHTVLNTISSTALLFLLILSYYITRSEKLYFIVDVLTFTGGNVVIVISTFLFLSYVLCFCVVRKSCKDSFGSTKKYKYWAECNRMFSLEKLSK